MIIFSDSITLPLDMITDSLIKWYLENKRDLPWRNTHNPYLIWLSEVILQQTRVEQGLPFYNKISSAFPTIEDLAHADKDEFFKLWQGLGYYRRAENALATARMIVEEYQGTFPRTYDGLLKLKGIGPYTAAAVASIAFNEPHPVLDGNVYRVLSRLYAIQDSSDSSAGKKLFFELAKNLVSPSNPSYSNQAMMELGALICTPKSPNCVACPLSSVCMTNANGTQLMYPVRKQKNSPKLRYLHYLIIEHKKHLLIHQRKHDEIWRNLYEPPFIETTKQVNDKHVLKIIHSNWISEGNNGTQEIAKIYQTKHQLTHQQIHATFWMLKSVKLKPSLKNQYLSVTYASLKQYPVHRLFDKFLNYYTLHF